MSKVVLICADIEEVIETVPSGMSDSIVISMVLFFEKGKPTKEIWYYEHPYPEGVKSYNKTKPIRIEEFAPEKAWWTNRTETAHAWRVPVEQVIEGLALRPPLTHVALTGRGAPPALLERADLVTEMTKIAHPMDAGRKGQRGLEW